jgi:hypothetical protein
LAADAVGKMPEQLLPLEWCGEEDARVTLAIIEVRGDDELLPCECLGPGERRAPAVGEGVTTLTPWAATTDAVRVREGQQQPRTD